MDAITTMLAAIQREPADGMAWLALADVLCEQGYELRAELIRVQLALRQPVVANEEELERRLRQLWSVGVTPCLPMMPGPFGIECVLIPPGSYWLGATENEPWADEAEFPRRRVTLTRGFWLGTRPITQRQWEAVIGRNPSHHRWDRSRYPVEMVSYDDCWEFCARLSETHGLACRLPTEAEWEYACRAGTLTMYAAGDGVEALRRMGWCSYEGDWDAAGGTRQVAEFQPNNWGLFDMHGNVWEWCADWFDRDAYATGPPIDPRGPEQGAERVVRGGSYRGGPWFCRSASRRGFHPSTREINIGFRVAIDWSPQGRKR